MSEFKKELEKNMELRKIAYKREDIDSDFFVAKLGIERIFKGWQPPKPLVVVPQFVSDWFDINQDDIDGNIKALNRNIDHNPKSGWSEMDRWFMYSPNKPIETLISMQLNGYTVEKEKKYILKHIDMSKLYTDVSLYLAHGFCKELDHVFYKDVNVHNADECHFTQSEIDKLNIGSYEKIEVHQ